MLPVVGLSAESALLFFLGRGVLGDATLVETTRARPTPPPAGVRSREKEKEKALTRKKRDEKWTPWRESPTRGEMLASRAHRMLPSDAPEYPTYIYNENSILRYNQKISTNYYCTQNTYVFRAKSKCPRCF